MLLAPAVALLFKGFQFVDEEVEADDTRSVWVGRYHNVVAAKDRTLRPVKEIGWGVKKDVVVLILNVPELVEKVSVERLLPRVWDLMLKIHA